MAIENFCFSLPNKLFASCFRARLNTVLWWFAVLYVLLLSSNKGQMCWSWFIAFPSSTLTPTMPHTHKHIRILHSLGGQINNKSGSLFSSSRSEQIQCYICYTPKASVIVAGWLGADWRDSRSRILCIFCCWFYYLHTGKELHTRTTATTKSLNCFLGADKVEMKDLRIRNTEGSLGLPYLYIETEQQIYLFRYIRMGCKWIFWTNSKWWRNQRLIPCSQSFILNMRPKGLKIQGSYKGFFIISIIK